MDWAEACRILGVAESATEQEIKEQYLYKAQLLHPDKNQDKPENIRRKAEAELALVNQAFSFLGNPINNPYRIPPKLALEPTAIRFKDVDVGERKSTTLIVRNVGGPYTSIWMDNQPAPWLTVTGVKSITSERLPLEVTLECTAIGEPGHEYMSDLLIKLENESTHAVDQAIVKIELLIKSKSAETSMAKRVTNPVTKLNSKPLDNPLSSTSAEKKRGFSVKAFLFNLVAFAVIGVVLSYLVFAFLKIDEVFFIIALIIYSTIAFGVSFNQGFTAGSRNEKARKNEQTGSKS
jgi:hypothetical protein